MSDLLTADAFPETFINPDLAQDERFTTRETMDWVQRVVGVQDWDLDVAACEESHWAQKYFTKDDDGLRGRWFGRVFCNPPFSDLRPWIEKAWVEAAQCDLIAMIIPANRTEQPFWHEHIEPFRDGRVARGFVNLTTHFIPVRTRFGHPGNPDAVGVGSPPFATVLLVWRRQ